MTMNALQTSITWQVMVPWRLHLLKEIACLPSLSGKAAWNCCVKKPTCYWQMASMGLQRHTASEMTCPFGLCCQSAVLQWQHFSISSSSHRKPRTNLMERSEVISRCRTSARLRPQSRASLQVSKLSCQQTPSQRLSGSVKHLQRCCRLHFATIIASALRSRMIWFPCWWCRSDKNSTLETPAVVPASIVIFNFWNSQVVLQEWASLLCPLPVCFWVPSWVIRICLIHWGVILIHRSLCETSLIRLEFLVHRSDECILILTGSVELWLLTNAWCSIILSDFPICFLQLNIANAKENIKDRKWKKSHFPIASAVFGTGHLMFVRCRKLTMTRLFNNFIEALLSLFPIMFRRWLWRGSQRPKLHQHWRPHCHCWSIQRLNGANYKVQCGRPSKMSALKSRVKSRCRRRCRIARKKKKGGRWQGSDWRCRKQQEGAVEHLLLHCVQSYVLGHRHAIWRSAGAAMQNWKCKGGVYWL